MKNTIVLPFILFAVINFQFSAYSQQENKNGQIVFVLADEQFPDVASNQNTKQNEPCEKIQSWVKSNEVKYFQLLQNKEIILSINPENINALPLSKQNDFALCLENLKSSFQCQRFQLIFNKQELSGIHHDKTIRQFHYLISKNDFSYITNIIED